MNQFAATFDSIVPLIDIIAFVVIVPAIFIIWFGRRNILSRRVRLAMSCILALLCFHNLSNVLESLKITDALDVYEDYSELLLPVLYFFVIYSFTQERNIRELRESEEQLLEAQRIAHIGNWSRDLITGEIYWSDELFRIAGCERREVTSKWIDSINHPDDRLRLREAYKAVHLGQSSSVQEFRIVRPDGEVRYIQDRWESFFDDDGQEIRRVGTAQDITDRKLVEEALRESEENFQAFFNIVDDFMIVATSEGRILYTNPAVSEKLEYSESDLLSMNLLDLRPADKRKEAEEYFAAVIRGERDTCSLPLISKDGVLIPVETRIWFGKWSGENSIFCISKNLSDVLEAEQRFESIFRLNPTPMALSSHPERKFVDVNDAYLETLGYSWEEIIGKTSSDLGVVVHSDQHDAITEQLRSEGNMANVEMQVRRKDGTILDGIFWGEMIGIQGEEYFLTTMLDVTKRKQAEEALRESEERFRDLAEMLPEVVFETDLNLRVTYANRHAFELFGYSQEDFAQGLIGLDIIAPVDRERVMKNLALRIKGESRGTIEYLAVKKDGSTFPVLFHANSIMKDGEVVGLRGIVVDITDRKEAEEALRVSEAYIQSVFRATPTGIGVVVDRVLKQVNERFCEMTGYSREELLDQSARILYPSDEEFEKVGPGCYEQICHHGIGTVETHWKHKDGRIIDILLKSALMDTGKSSKEVTFTVLDITDRKRAERELIREKTFSDATIDTMPGIFYLFNERGRFIRWNRNLEIVSGYSAEEIAVMKPDEFFVQDERVILNEAILEVFEKGRSFIEITQLSKDGSTAPFLLTGARFEAEGMLYLVGMGLDITDRKRVEEALRESESRLLEAQRIAHIGSFSSDLVTGEIYWSDEIFRIIGLERQKVTLELFTSITHPDDLPRLQDAMNAARAGQRYSELDFRIVRLDGEVRYIHERWDSFFDDSGNEIRQVGVAEDITDRKLAEQEREALITDLEAANTELERFTYTVSHDLKSPLITIKGFLNILEQDIKKDNIQNTGDSIQRIDKAAKTMQELLDDLLELSRIGRMINPLEEIPFGEIVSEALSMTAGQIAERGVEVKVLPDLPVVYCDSIRMMEVVQNLISNSVNFIGEQSNPVIEIGGSNEGDFVLCYVRDNGIGIDPEYHKKIFELFDTLDRNSEGTGIGLALVKRIIEFHGGKVWVESEGVGHGCTFKFTLPVKKGGVK